MDCRVSGGNRSLTESNGSLNMPEYKSAYDLARDIVQYYAPLTKGSIRLPSYKQPDITLKISPSCHPDFAALMGSICAKLDLTDRTQFSEDECRLFCYQRLNGWNKLYTKGLSGQELLYSSTDHKDSCFMLINSMTILLGEKILARIGRDHCNIWFPWNDFSFVRSKSSRQFTIECTSLSQHVTKDGRLFYYSSKKHTVTLRGKTHIVAFSPHAIQRIAERIVYSPTSYADLGDIFGFVNHYQYFEPAILYPQQDAFSFFQACSNHFFSAQYAHHILDNLDPDKKYAYRAGYCPVVEEGEFFLAKTVLVPGYVGTPEYSVLLKTSFDNGVKKQMLERCNHHSFNMTVATQDFSLLRWFHTHGVPQVITYTTPLFDDDPLTDPRFDLVV